MHHGKPETGAATAHLGGEERIEDAAEHSGLDTASRIGDRETGVGSRSVEHPNGNSLLAFFALGSRSLT